jgi:hypothetical protein
MFILRHLVHAAKQIKPKGCSHLHTAFIDFKQAYDAIDRPHLWNHLNNIRMPTDLVNIIKQIYDGDEYVLIDGAKTTSTGTTVPLRGIKQGRPLSPLLFSLFISDVDDEFGTGFMGAVTGTEGLRVTHMLYADDLLTLTAIDPVQLQKMLRRLESYAARKGFTVNVQKSYIVNLMRTEIPQFLFFVSTIRSLKREILLPTWECYLKHINLNHAATHPLRPFNAALRRVKEFGFEKRISDRPHAMLWLFKTYALSAGMYASQILSTQFLKHYNGFSNPSQVAHMAF